MLVKRVYIVCMMGRFVIGAMTSSIQTDKEINLRKNSWFRFYNNVVDNPKVQLLDGDLIKDWVNLLCLASRNGGWLPEIEVIAFALRCSEDDAQSKINILVRAVLFDYVDGRCRPHDWSDWQYVSDHSTDRSAASRARKKQRNRTVAGNGSATDQRQSQI